MIFLRLFLIMAFGISCNNTIFSMKSNSSGKPNYSESLSQKLFEIVEQEDCEREDVESLLKEGDAGLCADPNIRDIYGAIPLYHAICYDKREIVTLFLEYGADPNTRSDNDKTLLYYAVWFGRLEIVKLLLKHMSNLYTMNMRSSITYLCSIDKKFQNRACMVMMYAKRFFKKHKQLIAKDILIDLLLDVWRQEHPADYRCIIWFGNGQQFLKDWIHLRSEGGYTVLEVAREHSYEEIERCLEEFKKEYDL